MDDLVFQLEQLSEQFDELLKQIKCDTAHIQAQIDIIVDTAHSLRDGE